MVIEKVERDIEKIENITKRKLCSFLTLETKYVVPVEIALLESLEIKYLFFVGRQKEIDHFDQ